MPNYGEVARGLADVEIYVLGANDAPGTAIDAPGARSLTWSVDQDSEDWEGDDSIIVTSYDNKKGSGTFTTARANAALFAAVMGSTAVISGTGDSEVTTVDESDEPSDVSVMIKGQARSLDQAGSTYRVTLHKAMVGSPSEKLELKAYNEPSMDFSFIKNASDKFITREWYKTRVDLPATITP